MEQLRWCLDLYWPEPVLLCKCQPSRQPFQRWSANSSRMNMYHHRLYTAPQLSFLPFNLALNPLVILTTGTSCQLQNLNYSAALGSDKVQSPASASVLSATVSHECCRTLLCFIWKLWPGVEKNPGFFTEHLPFLLDAYKMHFPVGVHENGFFLGFFLHCYVIICNINFSEKRSILRKVATTAAVKNLTSLRIQQS